MRKLSFVLSLLALGLMAVPSTTYAQYGGGGGSSTNPPPSYSGSLKINNGAASTSDTKVTLTMPTTNAGQMAISNDSSFANTSWETFSSSKSWVLTPSYGTKTVYAMFRNASTGAATQIMSATIELKSATTATATTTTQQTTTQTTPTTQTTQTTAATTATTGATTAATAETGGVYNFTKYLAVGSSGTEVTELQTLLKSLGYFTYSTITGYYGPATQAAVIAYQKANSLAPYPGYVGPATRVALSKVKYKATTTTTQTTTTVAATTQTTTQVKYKFTSYLTVGSSGEEVKQLQLKLKELGYFTYATATGYFGTVTQDAVVKFQKAKNLAPYPGYVGPGTRAELNK